MCILRKCPTCPILPYKLCFCFALVHPLFFSSDSSRSFLNFINYFMHWPLPEIAGKKCILVECKIFHKLRKVCVLLTRYTILGYRFTHDFCPNPTEQGLVNLTIIRAMSKENVFMPYAFNKGTCLISTFVVCCLGRIIPILA